MVSNKNQMTLLVAIVVIAAGVYIANTLGYIGGAAPSGGAQAPSAQTTLPGCVLSTTQTMNIVSYDADNTGSVVTATTNVIFLASGGLNPYGSSGMSNTTVPGTAYKVLVTKSNYASSVVSVPATQCNPSASATAYLKAIDTAVASTVFNTNGVTANTVAANLSIASSGSGTAHVKMSSSASFKHLSGETGKFQVYLNVSNNSKWSAAQTAISFDGVACVDAGTSGSGVDNSVVPAALSGGVAFKNVVCSGDFLPNGGEIHDLAIKLQAASGQDPIDILDYVTYSVAAVNPYQNTLDSNKLEYGAIKDSGAALQALQSGTIYVG